MGASAFIYLLNPSWRAMSSALTLLLPLWQWKTKSSSSFSGASTWNFCWNCSGDSFRDSSRLPTKCTETIGQLKKNNKKNTLFTLVNVFTLTWDVDSIWDVSSLVFIRISDIEKLYVMIGQHGLQLGVGDHWGWGGNIKDYNTINYVSNLNQFGQL